MFHHKNRVKSCVFISFLEVGIDYSVQYIKNDHFGKLHRKHPTLKYSMYLNFSKLYAVVQSIFFSVEEIFNGTMSFFSGVSMQKVKVNRYVTGKR